MKKTIYRAENRGFTNLNWLKSYHTFNFANYYEEDRSGFGNLMVLNVDSVQPGAGYGTHQHDNVEIISIPLLGKIAHKDDFGNESTICRGEVQVISAGRGMTHSEFNPSPTDLLHFLEIWILPNRVDGDPRHQVKRFTSRKDKWAPVIHPQQKDETLSIYQDACLCLGKFDRNVMTEYQQDHPYHGTFLMVLGGKIEVMEEQLHPYDAIGLEETPSIQINCLEESQILVIEIPMRKAET